MKALIRLMILCVALMTSYNVFAISSHTAHEKILVLTVNSLESGKAIPFSGSYMIITNKDSKLVQLNETTPFTVEVNAKMLAVMINTDKNNPRIKAEIIEKKANTKLVSGGGHAIIATAPMGFVIAQ